MTKSRSKDLRVQVLVSTMNQTTPSGLIEAMGIQTGCVIINQVTNLEKMPADMSGEFNVVRSYRQRGLSKSRNKAISLASANICVIADDDMTYADGYENIIKNGYLTYPDADIIGFYVDSNDIRQKKTKMKQGRLGLVKTMKLASWNITFRRDSIAKAGIMLDESFGAGTDNYMGEENIFLFDCTRKRLKIYYIPITIAQLNDTGASTWFSGYDKRFFTVQGKVFYRMSPVLSSALILQYAIRKKHLYRDSLSPFRAAAYMFQGAIDSRKINKQAIR